MTRVGNGLYTSVCESHTTEVVCDLADEMKTCAEKKYKNNYYDTEINNKYTERDTHTQSCDGRLVW